MSENTVLGVKKRPQGTYDVLLDLKEPAVVSASAAGTSKLYIGTGLYKACAILDVESIATTADGLLILSSKAARMKPSPPQTLWSWLL